MARTAKSYKLIPAEVPPRRGRRGSVYADMIAEFVASGETSVLVEAPGRKPPALALGLRKAAAAAGGVRVTSRGDQVYLERL